MRKSLTAAGLAAFACVVFAKDVELTVGYAYDIYFKEAHRLIAEEFMKNNPTIKVKFRPAYKSYEEAARKVIEESGSDARVDVSFQGLNRLRIFAERELAVPLDELIADDETFKDHGLETEVLDIGSVDGKVYALPFALATPIVYVNADLFLKVGYAAGYCPGSWDEIIAAAAKIDKLDNATGLFFGWDITGNWLHQALVLSQGGKLVSDDEKVALLDSKEARWAMEMLARLVTETEMEGYAWQRGNVEFGAGRLGMYVWSTSSIGAIDRLRGGKFALKTCRFPLNDAFGEPGSGRLPTAGNGAMLHTKDAEKQQAAWAYIKAATSPFASKTLVETTGYMPVNSKAMNSAQGLSDFYANNPNHMTSVEQLPVSTRWYAWPGENAIKITDVIRDYNQAIVSRERAGDVEALVNDMQRDVQALLP